MSKLKEHKLKNGLTVYLCKDKSKHSVTTHLITKLGGASSFYSINNENYKVKRGMAHLLEHYLIEQSTFGIIVHKLNEIFSRGNGYTTPFFTCYYFDAVTNIYESLDILLNGIHKPIFSNERLEFTKNSIREEIRGKHDIIAHKMFEARNKNLFGDLINPSTIGEISDIDNINLNDIIKMFESFYVPENEIIIVAGNFNEKEVLDTITDIYEKINFKSYNIVKTNSEYYDKVCKKEETIYFPVTKTIYELSFKVPIRNFNKIEIMKLDWYLTTFLKTNFGILSNTNLNLKENKIIDTRINYSKNKYGDYFVIYIGAYVNDIQKFKKTILNILQKPIYDEEIFELENNQNKINILLREENLRRLIDPFIDNLIRYNFDKLDSIDFIETFSFNEYKNLISKLNFDNYTEITVLDKKS